MLDKLRALFSLPELKKKILWTLGLLAVCRIGVFVPVPGIDGHRAMEMFRFATKGGQNLFQMMDMFSGGAFAQMTIFALGVMPYITASIIVQVLTTFVPSMQREMRENQEQGRRKMLKLTRLFTIGMALSYSGLYAYYTLQRNAAFPGMILDQILQATLFGVPWLYFVVVMTAMTVGTTVLMWIGEQITEKGVGNGVSLIITLGILSSLPSIIGRVVSQLGLESQDVGSLSMLSVLVMLALFVFIVIGTILVIQGERRIPLQYARRVVGMREMQGSGAPFLPLKVNYAGVIPVIFASAFLTFPAIVFQFLAKGAWGAKLAATFAPGATTYNILYVLLIFGFTYFWTRTQFNPEQIASDMKRGGAFIPGIRQGNPTQKFLNQTMGRITLLGALSLVVIAILPMLVSRLLRIDSSISHFFGGTSLLILVGVILDTSRQVKTHLLQRSYDGLMRKSKVRGR